MSILAKRRKLFPTPAEVSARDHGLRLMRRAQPIEQLHTTRGDEAYGLVTVVTFSETKQGGPLPIKATLDTDGRYCMSRSLERRITADDAPTPRDYVTVPELATLLDVSPPTITKGLSDKGMEMYRPGGEFGKRRVRLSTVETYLRACQYSPERIAEIIDQVRKSSE